MRVACCYRVIAQFENIGLLRISWTRTDLLFLKERANLLIFAHKEDVFPVTQNKQSTRQTTKGTIKIMRLNQIWRL